MGGSRGGPGFRKTGIIWGCRQWGPLHSTWVLMSQTLINSLIYWQWGARSDCWPETGHVGRKDQGEGHRNQIVFLGVRPQQQPGSELPLKPRAMPECYWGRGNLEEKDIYRSFLLETPVFWVIAPHLGPRQINRELSLQLSDGKLPERGGCGARIGQRGGKGRRGSQTGTGQGPIQRWATVRGALAPEAWWAERSHHCVHHHSLSNHSQGSHVHARHQDTQMN